MSNPGPWSQPEPEPPQPPQRRTASALRFLVWLAVLGALAGVVWLLARRFPGQDRQDWSGVGWGVALLVAASARILSGGPVNWGQTTRHAAAWVGLVAIAALGFTYRAELIDVGQRVRGELIPGLAQTSSGQGGARELVISQTEAGYQIMGQVNGEPVRFIVDTGATDTVLSPADAHRAGLDSPSLDFSHLAETANGTGRGARAVAASVSAGGIEFRDMPVVINAAPMSTSLLGMSFLRRLEGFEVRGGRLYLRAKR
jgi:aspartyl protease family protein